MNTIFKKQFFMYTCALITSFILLWTGLTKAFSSFFIKQKQENLIQQAEKISQVYKQSLFFGGNIEKEINKIEKYLECSFIIADKFNYILYVSNDVDKRWIGGNLTIYGLEEKSYDGILKYQGTIGGIFSEPMVIVGYPITIGGIDTGTIFASTPVTDLIITVEKSYKIIVVLMIVSILIAFLLIYICSRKVSLPLIEINKAAKIMADGNFNKQIYIDSKDEIGQLANVLNEMAKNLNEQEKRRREFISNISHDIRSPLTSMKGFLEALIDGTIPEEKRERYLHIILEETERLTKLSNNILDINKLEHINENVQNVKFNINQLIRNIIINFEARLISKSIKINASFEKEELIVLADIEKIERVIYNLIDNAIKFTDNGKNIFISTKTKADKVLVSIKDEGRGIAPDMQKRVFERFYKVDASRGEDKKGSGLGLSIVKEFILAQGENIYLNSELNKGSEFIFTLQLEN